MVLYGSGGASHGAKISWLRFKAIQYHQKKLWLTAPFSTPLNPKTALSRGFTLLD